MCLIYRHFLVSLGFAYERKVYFMLCIVIAFVKRIEICCRDFVE